MMMTHRFAAVMDDVAEGRPPTRRATHVGRLDLRQRQTADRPVHAWATAIETHYLDATECATLERLPASLTVTHGWLRASGCTRLEQVACRGDGLSEVDLTGCTALTDLPPGRLTGVQRLVLQSCSSLRRLPADLTVDSLDLSGCTALRHVPDGMRVRKWIDVADSGITGLPDSLAGVEIRWRGVRIDARIAFWPETITAAQVLAEENAEVRRVMLERMGAEKFVAEADATVLDEDADPGGRRLLSVPLAGDEPLVCVEVRCPSTDDVYLLRVPPGTTTCRQAIAWTAGFDDADQYAPVAET